MIGIGLLLLGALAVLITVLLFGFVGCGLDLTGELKEYSTAITDTPGLVAYWRLQEPSSTPVPSSGGAAKCENNPAFNGDYFKLNRTTTPDEKRQSNKTDGTLNLGFTPGILDLLPSSTCMKVGGGFVKVPFSGLLNPPAFTFEAWCRSRFPGVPPLHQYYQCLVESSGPQGLGGRSSGWGLYLGPLSPLSPPDDPLFWQVWMFDDTKTFRQVATAEHPVRHNLNTYLALTFDGITQLQLFLYFPGTNQDLSLDGVRFLSANVPGFKPNDSGDLFIGTGSNLFPDVGPPLPSQRLYPFRGEVQEVALYNVDLSLGGPQNILAFHELSGGNI